MKRMLKKGFTLVEILIVVIILGILAAIVIPQFTNASEDARQSSLISDLQSLRSQIELYKLQHHDQGPNGVFDANGDFQADNSSGTFQTRLLGATDEYGGSWESGETKYGPYLQTFPENPFTAADGNADEVSFDTDGSPAKDTSVGWIYDTTTGKIHASTDVDL
jgi:general secretion pathway protein G